MTSALDCPVVLVVKNSFETCLLDATAARRTDTYTARSHFEFLALRRQGRGALLFQASIPRRIGARLAAINMQKKIDKGLVARGRREGDVLVLGLEA